MSLRAPVFTLIPEETARVAHAAFPNRHIYMRMRDELGPIYHNSDFAHLFPHDGQPARPPAQLALVVLVSDIVDNSDSSARSDSRRVSHGSGTR